MKNRSILSRTLKLAGLATELTKKQAKWGIKKTFIDGVQQKVQKLKLQAEQAQEIVEVLSELKGAAMKAGQMLSMELRDYLPSEVVDILASLQDGSKKIEFSQIESVIESEWGTRETGALWSEIEDLQVEALASASIGQVHRLKIRGRDCVIKVQFPGVKEAVEADVLLLSKIARVFLKVSFKKIALDGVIKEIKETLKLEADYKNEAFHLKEYSKLLYKTQRELNCLRLFKLPNVIDSHSGVKVLALEYMEGMRFEDWLKATPALDQTIKNQIAYQFILLYFYEFYVWGMVQTDPNFGNYLFDQKNSQIVLLDFGAAKTYGLEFRKAYQKLVISAFYDDKESVLDLVIQLGWLDIDENQETKDKLYHLLKRILGLFKKQVQPINFVNQNFLESARSDLKDFLLSVKYTPPPHELIFLHRKLGGLYVLMRALEAQVDLYEVFCKLEKLEIK